MRSFVLTAIALVACASDAANEGGLEGSYEVEMSLTANTCGEHVPATNQIAWEFREVAREFFLVSDNGGQLKSTDGGHTFVATFPVDTAGCMGATSYLLTLVRDGDELSGSVQVTVELTSTCAALESCAYSYNVVAQRQ